MLAVHEHEARPFLSALDDHDTQGPTLTHDDGSTGDDLSTESFESQPLRV